MYCCELSLSTGDLQCAGKCSTKVCLVLGEEPGQAKITDLGLELVVQEDVAGLDVAMNDPQVRLLVQVLQTSRNANDDLMPGFPVQKR